MTPGAAVQKQRLRAELSAARRVRSDVELAAARAAVADIVLHRWAHDRFECVAAYEPLRAEPGSIALLDGLRARGVRVLVPITLADRDLDWVEWSPAGTGDQLGPEAIAAAGLVLAPALAAAADGTRLGRGGGSYDRALARCAATSVTAALLFDGEVLARLPSDPWDVPVRAAATPSGWRPLGRNTDVVKNR